MGQTFLSVHFFHCTSNFFRRTDRNVCPTTKTRRALPFATGFCVSRLLTLLPGRHSVAQTFPSVRFAKGQAGMPVLQISGTRLRSPLRLRAPLVSDNREAGRSCFPQTLQSVRKKQTSRLRLEISSARSLSVTTGPGSGLPRIPCRISLLLHDL